MINDLKIAIKMMKFGLNRKDNIAVAIIFFVLGILVTFALPFSNGRDITSLGGFYITMAGMYTGQLLMTTTIAKLVQTSPYKKKFQTSILIFITIVSTFILYTVFVLVARLTIAIFPEQYGNTDIMAQLILVTVATGLMGCFFQIYMSISFKGFVLSYIIMLGIMLPILFLLMGIFKFNRLLDFNYRITFPQAVGIGYLIMIVGAGLGYICSLLLYKRDISTTAYKAALRQIRQVRQVRQAK